MEVVHQYLATGKIVIYPTETFFGLAVDPCNKDAVDALLDIKSRDINAGIPLIAANVHSIDRLIDLESDEIKARRQVLQDKFWPGPLTIVFAASEYAKQIIASGVFGPDSTLAVRVSSLTVARELASFSPSGLITSTSANPKGLPPASSVQEATAYFSDFYVFDKDCAGKEEREQSSDQLQVPKKNLVPSTLVKTTKLPFEILREGAISASDVSLSVY